jgi:hypothetical protein
MILILREIKAAIIFQIWRNSISRRRARFAVRVIAESGLLYTLTSIATCCGVFFGSSHWLVLVIGIVCHKQVKCGWVPHLTHAPRIFTQQESLTIL